MTIKTITVANRPVKELYTGLEDPRSKKPGIRTSLPVRQPIEKDKNVKHNSKEFIKNERMIQTHELMRSNKPIGYSSKGKPVKVPNGATHYAAVIDSDNSVMQERSGPRKKEEKDPFDFARNLNDNIQDAAKAADLIEAKIDGFDIVKKGDNLIIKGAGSNTADKLGIKGTRYSVDNLGNYPNLGKLIDPKAAAKDALKDKGKLIKPIIGVVQNITNKEAGTKVIADAAVDTANETVSNAAAAISAAFTKAVIDAKTASQGAPPQAIPIVVGGAIAGSLAENAINRIDNHFQISEKAKEGLKNELDKLIYTDYSKPNNGKPIARHEPPQKHERANKPVKNDNKPAKNDKPAKKDPPRRGRTM